MGTKLLKPFLFFVMVLAAVSLACNFGQGGGQATEAPPQPVVAQPPDEQSPVEQPPEQQSPQTETPPPTEPPTLTPQDYFTEEFDGDTSTWKVSTELNASNGDLSEADIYVEDGMLVFELGKNLIGYVFYEPYNYRNVRIDVRVDNRGTNVNNVLLVCRVSDEGHYLVNIANSGLYAMYAFDGKKGTYTRIADGGSTKIRAGKETNEYSLVCLNKTLTLYINGNETRKYKDNDFVFKEGLIGVGVASENVIPVKLEFDWVKISQP